jgi:hypothetical protein
VVDLLVCKLGRGEEKDIPCEHADPIEHPEDDKARAAELPIEGQLERTTQEGVEELQ